MAEIVRHEELWFRFEIETAVPALTGAETFACHVRRAGVKPDVPDPAAAPLVLTPAFTPAAGPDNAFVTFSGPSDGLLPGRYLADGWMIAGARKVLLFKTGITVTQNATEFA